MKLEHERIDGDRVHHRDDAQVKRDQYDDRSDDITPGDFRMTPARGCAFHLLVQSAHAARRTYS